MEVFDVEVTPHIPRSAVRTRGNENLNALRPELLKQIPEKYQVIYHVNGDKFAYYPTDILTALNDLLGEIDELVAERSHYVSLGGYNVAYARCNNGRVWLYDPPEEFGREEEVVPSGAGLPIPVVKNALQEAAVSVREYINSRLPPPIKVGGG